MPIAGISASTLTPLLHRHTGQQQEAHHRFVAGCPNAAEEHAALRETKSDALLGEAIHNHFSKDGKPAVD